MTITNFRRPEKHHDRIGPEAKASGVLSAPKNPGELSDAELDALLKEGFAEGARAIEEDAMSIELGIPEDKLKVDAQMMLDNILAQIHADPELDAKAKAEVPAKDDTDELIRLGRALKESGKTLEDVIRDEEIVFEKKPSGHRRRISRPAKMFAGVAASLLIVFTVSMNSSAMKNFLIERLGWKIGENPATTINTDGELHFSEDREYSEVEALEVIKNELGIAPLFFNKKPEDMDYDDVYVEQEAQWAKMFYTYNGKIMTVIMDKSDENMSMAISYDGEKIEEQEVELPLFATTAIVEMVQRDDKNTAFYAELEYGNAFYSIRGDMEEEVFLELIKNITFG